MRWKDSLHLLRRQWGWAVAATVVLAMGVTIGRAFWIMRTPEQRVQVTWDRIAVPTPPDHVPPTLFKEIRQSGGLPEVLDLRDPTLATRLQDAIARYPWVQQVDQVRIIPGKGISVELTYRTPVASVQGPFRQASEPHYVVDADGRCLPTADARAATLPRIRITGVQDRPKAPGELWGAAVVERAARLAALLATDEADFQIVEIKLDADLLLPDVRLVSSDGTQVVWCAQDEHRAGQEPTDEVKLTWLRDYARAMGGLAKPAGPSVLDVRKRDGMTRQPLR